MSLSLLASLTRRRATHMALAIPSIPTIPVTVPVPVPVPATVLQTTVRNTSFYTKSKT